MKTFYTIISLALSSFVYSQTFEDAVRYSEYMPLGTARTVGAGSSFGAMGGDYSVISINPAGIGFFYKNEFTVSPGLGLTNTEATLNEGNTGSEKLNKTGFGVDNLGYVSANFDPESDWYTSNYAIGISRSKSFGREYRFEGVSQGTIAERWQQLADGLSPDELNIFETGLAFDSGVLIEGDNNSYDIDLYSDDEVSKSQAVRQSGFINELSLGWASNYRNIISFGISAGIPFLSFSEEKIYSESFNFDGEFNNDLSFTQDLSATGAGINIKAGMIYNLSPIRVGLAFHTPTWYTIEEEYATSVDYRYEYLNPFENGGSLEESGPGEFTYNLSSPWKAIGSIGTLLNFGIIKGFVNADVEYINYKNVNFNLTVDSDSFEDSRYEDELNAEIDDRLNSGVNLRLGTELAINSIRVRAGYAMLKSPYKGQPSNTAISLGTGYRFSDNFYIDLGYRLETASEQYSPYASADESRDPNTTLDSNYGRAVATFGFKF